MKKITGKPPTDDQAWKEDKQKIPDTKLPAALTEKMQMLKPYLEKSHDIISRPFYLEGKPPLEAVSIYINKVIDDEDLNQHILRPLMLNCKRDSIKELGSKNLIDAIYQTSITLTKISKANTLPSLVQNIFDGMTVLMFDGLEEVLVIDMHGGEFRAIDTPPAEQTMRGSREGFIERLDINIALIRRRLRDPKLVVEKTMVGRRSRTQVAVLYIEDIADPQIVTEVKKRINEIDIDGISASGFIEQFIEDNPYSIFPQVYATERPDRMEPLLLEGRIGIIVDNTPLALAVPALFVQFIQASEDYYERTLFSSYIRLMRYAALIIAIFLPAMYIALLSYQPELLPYDLLINFSKSRMAVPFPVVIEAFVMEIIIQLVIEAGLRLPNQIAQTVGVVSGIILGQAAISAKIASPSVILVISLSIICTYALPSTSMVLAVRFLRLPMMFLAATFGVFGLSCGWIIIQAHLISLDSMGVPYFAPLAPIRFGDLKDAFYRTFFWKMNQRPMSIPMQDRKRQGNTGGGSNNSAG
ncbi:MAG: spore germination protein [Syntrophomonas sp.]|nr:spore germination protein [Syntrophomonas sp.]